MRRLSTPLAAALAATLVLAACGVEHEAEVVEGEPLEAGELLYNVRLTRFLNRDDDEDRAYLRGRPPAPQGKDYLGVFLVIENEGDAPQAPSRDLEITDTRGNRYEPVESESIFALDFEPIPAGGELPRPDSPAAGGPIKGAMLLFLVDELVTENRPLALEIPRPGEDEPGTVELDI